MMILDSGLLFGPPCTLHSSSDFNKIEAKDLT